MTNDLQLDTRHAILDVAMHLAQTRGFNGFSYRDIATSVGIKTASIHYYFPTKEDLGRALLRHYTHLLDQSCAAIRTASTDALRQYRQFVNIFDATAKTDGRVCLAGMLASDLTTLPPALQADIRAFFAHAEGWITDVLRGGQAAGTFTFTADPAQLAAVIMATLEGGLLLGRVMGDPGHVLGLGVHLETLLRPR